eukprot:TRINITY_DN16593_c0_g1_i1.p1 TRINITY_DN16593_c0_g1~~TRINITY_DN16593_c0_g1_i1.p1  ORF type:complete len:131 (+),score=18.77 TRINITY_DN16593_c0_g1_i1:430-822(+)
MKEKELRFRRPWPKQMLKYLLCLIILFASNPAPTTVAVGASRFSGKSRGHLATKPSTSETHQMAQSTGLDKGTERHVYGGGERILIGSTKPICTYNECRGCRSRCRAEQVPVDANDPLNSAYHYKCVCHK